MASEEHSKRCHQKAIAEANAVLRQIKDIGGDDKQLAAGLALEAWQKVAQKLADTDSDHRVISAVFAWALKYNEAYWTEHEKSD